MPGAQSGHAEWRRYTKTAHAKIAGRSGARHKGSWARITRAHRSR
ncbi:hypothetical protein [Azospirillum largimobile]